jgi:hypothetical protein
MSDVNLDFVVSNNSINFTVQPNDITITPTDIQLTFFAGGMSTTANALNANINNVHISGGTNGYVLQTDGVGNLTWTAQTGNGGGGNGSPGGANSQVQYNDAGNFGGNAGFTFDSITGNLNVPGIINGNITNANIANYATTANAVAGANVSGQVGNALVAGTVYTNAQPNITSVGNLTNLIVTGTANISNIYTPASTIALGLNSNSAGQGVSIGYATGGINPGDDAIAIGDGAGGNNQGSQGIAIGVVAGRIYQGTNAVSLGTYAGYDHQGTDAIAIGFGAGTLNQPNNSIIINATGANYNGSDANAFYVKPIRNNNTSNLLFYNNSTGEITYDVLSNSLVANTANYANFAGQANLANLATFATTANAVAGANVSGTVANANYASTANIATYTGAVYVSNVTSNVQYLVLTSGPNNYNGLRANTQLSYNVSTGNLTAGNVSASQFNGSANGYVVQNAQPYITSIGTLSTLTANTITTNQVGNGTSFMSVPTVNGNITHYINGGGVLTLTQTSANFLVTANFANASFNNANATGNFTANNFVTSGIGGTITANGNITGGNLKTTNGIISTTNGNITAVNGYVIGGEGVFTNLRFVSNISSNASPSPVGVSVATHKFPIVLNGTTYYILLSNT